MGYLETLFTLDLSTAGGCVLLRVLMATNPVGHAKGGDEDKTTYEHDPAKAKEDKHSEPIGFHDNYLSLVKNARVVVLRALSHSGSNGHGLSRRNKGDATLFVELVFGRISRTDVLWQVAYTGTDLTASPLMD